MDRWPLLATNNVKKISTNNEEAGVCLGALPQTGDSLKLFIVLQTAETKAHLPASADDPLKYGVLCPPASPHSFHSFS